MEIEVEIGDRRWRSRWRLEIEIEVEIGDRDRGGDWRLEMEIEVEEEMEIEVEEEMMKNDGEPWETLGKSLGKFSYDLL